METSDRGGADAAAHPPGYRAARLDWLTVQPLTETERAVLALEKRTWRRPGSKERAIRRELGMGAVEYHLRLNALLDDPRAIAAEPALTRRLREQRDPGGTLAP